MADRALALLLATRYSVGGLLQNGFQVELGVNLR
jgi:hypothetical protein